MQRGATSAAAGAAGMGSALQVCWAKICEAALLQFLQTDLIRDQLGIKCIDVPRRPHHDPHQTQQEGLVWPAWLLL
jgi:hypothetical protein